MPPVGGDRDGTEALDLGLELDPEALLDPPTSFGHHLDHLRGRRRAVVLDEIRVLLGEAGAADPQPAAAGRVQQLAGAAPAGGRVGRVSKVEPNVLICGRLRLASSPAQVRQCLPGLMGLAALSRNRARATTSPAPGFEQRSANVDSSRAPQSVPDGVTTSTSSSAAASSPAVGVRRSSRARATHRPGVFDAGFDA